MNQNNAIAAAAGNTVIPALRRASAATGVDFQFLLEQARTESSLNPKAQTATSSARGLFQFIESTWLDMVDKHGAKYGLSAQAAAIHRDGQGRPVVADANQRAAILRLRDDPYLSGVMAGELARENASVLQEQLGRPAKPGELYMAHFLGAQGAARFLDGLQRNPDLAASHVLPGAARANAAVFFNRGHALSLQQVYARFDERFNSTANVAQHDGSSTGSPAASSTGLRLMAAASSGPATANLSALATQMAALARQAPAQSLLALPEESTATDDQALAAALATRTATSRAARLPPTVPAQLAAASDALQLGEQGQASLFSLRLLQALTLPGERNSQQQRRWLA